MNNVLLIVVFLITSTCFSQANKYSKVTPGPQYKARTLNETMVAPMYLREVADRNARYILDLQKKILELKTIVVEQPYSNRLDDEYKVLTFIYEKKDLARAGDYIRKVELNVIEIGMEYVENVIKKSNN